MKDGNERERVGSDVRGSGSRWRPGRVVLRFALVIASSLVAFLVGEGAYRLWLRVRGVEYDGARLQLVCERAVDSMAAFVPEAEAEPGSSLHFALHPYWGAQMRPDAGPVLTYFEEDPPEDAYEVLVVGGSVAAGWSLAAEKDLVAALQGSPRFEGRRVVVLGFAHPAFKEPQQLARVSYLFSLGYRPDAVINLDGFNEVAVSLESGRQGTSPVYPGTVLWQDTLLRRRATEPAVLELLAETSRLKRDSKALLERASSFHLFRSSVLGRLVAARLGALDAERDALRERMETAFDESYPRYRSSPECCGPPFEASDEAIVERAAGIWYESSRSIDALCRSRGTIYLHCLQPTLCDPGSKPLSAKEREVVAPEAWARGVDLGYPLLRARGAALVAEGVAFVDLGGCFAEVEETLYTDSCHLGTKGNRLLTALIARHLLALTSAVGSRSGEDR